MKYPIIKSALEVATKSNAQHHKMGCVIFQGKKIISKGYNTNIGKSSLHAEANSIEKVVRSHGLLKEFRRVLNSSLRNPVGSVTPYSLRECRKGLLQAIRCPSEKRW